MNVGIVNELLSDEKASGLILLFATNEEEQVDEIDKEKSNDNTLYVTVPKKAVINLDYVVKINIITKFKNETVNKSF
ncbi:hypothetical protein [Staphylococcus durrellii]|uniref:hypothetical protein n=1 Tax=Staphylococcus durrellii TaxID=2781773 RepID=UPI00189F9900|nr:hypothetical protein [Staphylococcus durrellii]MBF7018056.1 hypothetical protein [Staphylococcus durrellii]